jgi:hypothetical protein
MFVSKFSPHRRRNIVALTGLRNHSQKPDFTSQLLTQDTGLGLCGHWVRRDTSNLYPRATKAQKVKYKGGTEPQQDSPLGLG